LEHVGLPWFYFVTLENLRPEFHEEFLREAEKLWGFEAGNDAIPGNSVPTDNNES
jgi:hypothetical protein